MVKNICKINKDNNIENKRGIGFFTKIPVDDKLIPVLVTNYHVFNKKDLDEKNEIEVNLFNEESKIIRIKDKAYIIKNMM